MHGLLRWRGKMFRKKIMALFFILSILLMGVQIAWAENIDNMEDSEKDYSSIQASVENMESETEENKLVTVDNPFQGCTIVVTGKLMTFTRDGINTKIWELGGKPGSSVSKNTDYLICGEKAGSKLAKAQSLGIKILSEVEFLDMIA